MIVLFSRIVLCVGVFCLFHLQEWKEALPSAAAFAAAEWIAERDMKTAEVPLPGLMVILLCGLYVEGLRWERLAAGAAAAALASLGGAALSSREPAFGEGDAAFFLAASPWFPPTLLPAFVAGVCVAAVAGLRGAREGPLLGGAGVTFVALVLIQRI